MLSQALTFTAKTTMIQLSIILKHYYCLGHVVDLLHFIYMYLFMIHIIIFIIILSAMLLFLHAKIGNGSELANSKTGLGFF